ncbi:MAG: extracellular solute-binding protein [Saccharofermentanales bacterium]
MTRPELTLFLRRYTTFLAAVSILLTASGPWGIRMGAETAGLPDGAAEDSVLLDDDADWNVQDYLDARALYETSGYEESRGFRLELGLDAVTDSSADPAIIEEADALSGILTDETRTWVEFTFRVPESALYVIGSSYYTEEGTGLVPMRRISVNGMTAFSEMANIPFYRKFQDSTEVKLNSLGDEVLPQVEERSGWSFDYFHDNMGKYPQPLLFYLEEGANTVRIDYVDQPLLMSGLVIASPGTPGSYDDYISGQNGSRTSGFHRRYEAEQSMLYRNDSSVGLYSDGDPLVSPSSVGKIRLNTVGGFSFRSGGQEVVFEVEVPEAGLYHINIRSKQLWGGNLPSFRSISINGAIPFDAMESYAFTFSRKWQNSILSADGQEPALFYLDAGKNRIGLTVNLGDFTDALKYIGEALLDLSVQTRRIMMITGADPDPNKDYGLDITIPDLLGQLQAIVAELEQAQQILDRLSIASDSVTGNNLGSVIRQLREMADSPDRIPRRLNDLSSLSATLGDLITSIPYQPLQIDYIDVFSPDVALQDYHSSFFDIVSATFTNFIYSFFRDYNKIGSLAGNSGDASDSLYVWIGRGKEWADILKTLSDSDFTQKTGIEINLNVFPSGQIAAMSSVNPLMLAISAGNAPDIALSVPSSLPVEYSFRNAVADLSQFDGFEEVQSRFLSPLMVAFQSKGKVYGFPETMSFRGMFYRKDVLQDLGIGIPDTWEDVYSKVLPKLYENGMQMYIPAWFDMFLMSNGGSYYSDDLLRSALDEPEAYDAFKMMCDLYTVYGVPTSANFFNRFRTAEMPIGIEGAGMYLQLMAAAPDLAGRWEMAMLPGVMDRDGQISRSTSGYVSDAVVILSSSRRQQEAFDFIDWWTSTDIQTRFAVQVEGRIGNHARWLTSNVESFKKLPWNKADLDSIVRSWDSVIEVPNILGGYFTSRHIGNAWNRTVVSGVSARDSLEKCVKDINKELRRRQEQPTSVKSED